MLKTTLYLLIAFGLWISSAEMSLAGPQRDAVCQGSCGGACGPCRGDVGNYREPYVAPPPTADEIAEQDARNLNTLGIAANKSGNHSAAENYYRQALDTAVYRDSKQIYRENLSHALLNEGNDAYSSGNYELALQYYQQALNFNPGNAAAKENIAKAKGWMAQQHADAAWKSGDYQAALTYEQQAYAYYPSDSIRAGITTIKNEIKRQEDFKAIQQQTVQTVSKLKDAINQTPSETVAVSSSLEFMQVGDGKALKNGNGNKVFGVASNPIDPELGGDAPIKGGSVGNTREQLSSMAKSSRQSVTANKIENVKNEAECGFSTNPCQKPDQIMIDKTLIQTQAALEMASHIPNDAVVRNDPEIQTNLAYYNKLEMHRADTQLKIADIQKKIDAQPSSAEVMRLKLDMGTLANVVKQDAKDQVNAKNQIKTKIKSYGLNWVETPAPAENTKSGNE